MWYFRAILDAVRLGDRNAAVKEGRNWVSPVDLTGMSVARVLSVLRGRKSTGALHVATTYRKVAFRLDDGEVTAVKSNRPADRLGLQMMKAGDIGVVDLHEALVIQHQQRLRAIACEAETERLGQILVDQKALNAPELAAALDRYVRSIVGALDKDLILDVQFDEDAELLVESLAFEVATRQAG